MNLSDALDIVRLTDVGLMREHNEDAVASDVDMGLVILADGMGGYNAGEVASEIAVLSIVAELKEAMLNFPANPKHDGGKLEAKLVVDAVNNANSAIFSASQKFPQCEGMGTTLVMGLFSNNRLLVGHIGDSRLYRLRHQTLAQLTEDHSLLQEQINAGLLSYAQAKSAPHKNLVTRALGIDEEVELELNDYEVEINDVYLLCSDGLSDLVDDDIIQSTLNTHSFSLTAAAAALVQVANDNGGKDNISVILVRVKNSFEDKYSWRNNLLGWLK